MVKVRGRLTPVISKPRMAVCGRCGRVKSRILPGDPQDGLHDAKAVARAALRGEQEK